MTQFKIEQLIKLQKLLLQLQAVQRAIRIPGTKDAWENDVEHSYSLAVICWMVAATEAKHLNTEKVIKYALIHDLVEAYAGDTHALASKKARKEKKVKEAKALKRMKSEEVAQALRDYLN